MSKPIQLTGQTFDAEVLQSSVPVLVDFWAEWCGPCLRMAPIVEDLAREYEGVVKVGKVDVDAQPDLAQRYGIASIPTLGYFQDGRLVDRFVGYRPKQELKRLIETARTRAA